MSTDPRNVHVPLPPDLYSGLRLEAKRAGKPATAVAREAIRRRLEKAALDLLQGALARNRSDHGSASSGTRSAR